jgi:hypothetical protein
LASLLDQWVLVFFGVSFLVFNASVGVSFYLSHKKVLLFKKKENKFCQELVKNIENNNSYHLVKF